MTRIKTIDPQTASGNAAEFLASIQAKFKRLLSATIFGVILSNSAVASTFVLVHGGFADSHVWDGVKPVLEAQGNQVVTIDLPAHGKDTTPADTVSLTSYVKAVEAKISGINGKVILVGHSMGGMVVSQVAENMPKHIQKIVYANAFVPINGESAISLLKQDKQAILGQYLAFSPDGKFSTIKPEGRVVSVCNDCPDSVKEHLSANGGSEPMQPFYDMVTLTPSHFGKVKKSYIFTTDDKAIGIDLQKWMAKRANIKQTVSFNTSHLPFVVDPSGYATVLIKISKD